MRRKANSAALRSTLLDPQSRGAAIDLEVGEFQVSARAVGSVGVVGALPVR